MFQTGYFATPPVVKNLLIINVLVFMAQTLLPIGGWIDYHCAMYYFGSTLFEPWQLITYMFMHANFTHIFANMLALWMFGRVLEYDLGAKRFLIFYMVSGIGAALIQQGVNWTESTFFYQMIGNIPTVGASGAVFGLLLAFAMFHPNAVIMLLIPPIPLKAKYFVIIYGIIELSMGVYSPGSSIAHFAHIGGMLWGYMLLHYWKSKGEVRY